MSNIVISASNDPVDTDPVSLFVLYDSTEINIFK
jgi:hypothetical protein